MMGERSAGPLPLTRPPHPSTPLHRTPLHTQDCRGASALMIAALGNHPAVVRCLLRTDARLLLEQVNGGGLTAMDMAAA